MRVDCRIQGRLRLSDGKPGPGFEKAGFGFHYFNFCCSCTLVTSIFVGSNTIFLLGMPLKTAKWIFQNIFLLAPHFI